ncbi:sulfite exporter TauE/SafE family protein [Bifidobacterium breve]|uniref:sulfite exporter TauE/SafE family protein n=1 Tax=Bifidobacterium breve TaxID=1685 RepID=UPI00298CBEF1|nr:sulfite exporter TauE/SafE family protein [Bifidobacterium breve]
MSEVSAEENHVDESPRGIAVMVVVGVLVGLLSGLFGIGGGTIIVPALVWLGLTQRHAAATSMLAIIPTSVSGVLSYAVNGNVDWIAALLVFIGMFVGGQIGSLLLSRLSEVVLRWAFVILSQLIFVPSRDSSIELNLVTGLLMVVFGVIAGILAGLLGVGGGAILVPSLSILFDASDLIARGTSLLAMFPNAVTTTVANVRRRMVHAKVGLIIGIVAALTAPLGTWIAEAMTPRTGEILFATYLTVLLIRSVWVALKITRKQHPWLSPQRGESQEI